MTLRGSFMLWRRSVYCRVVGHAWEERTLGFVCYRCYGWKDKP